MKLFGSTTDDEQEDAQDDEQVTIEGEYDPTVPKRVNGKEWWIERIDDATGEIETYAGSWTRAMMENAQYEPEQPVWMGCSERTGREFGVQFSRAFRHIAYLGSTGTGKTTAIYNSVTQLMMGGHGVAIVDPKGDDIYDLLRRVPKWRWDDVVYVDLGADYFSLEDEETGEDVPHQIGFNILDTYHDPGESGFDEEIEWIVADLIELLAAGEYWGPRMDRIAKNMIRGMARHSEEFTIIEIYYALLEEENRKQYADLIGDSIDDEDIMFLEGFTRRIADELDDNELDPLLGRLKDWVENPITRKIIAMRGASVTLGQIVNEQKILIVNNDLPKEAKIMTANAVVSGIWTAVTSRKDPSEQRIMELAGMDDVGSEYEPFFLAIDECHSVLTDGDEIETMLMEARSKKLGLMLSTQVLRSLPDDAADAIISNCNTILSLTPNHPEEAREIANRFGGMDADDLQRTPDYHAQTQLNSEDEPFLAKLIPPYPPRHSIEDAYELILTSLENYGTPAQSGSEILEEMHFDSGIVMPTENADGEMVEDPLGGDEQAERVVLKRVYDEQIMHGETVDASEIPLKTAKDAIKDEFELGMSQTSNLVEMLENKTYLRTRHADDGMRVSVSPNGIDRIGLDTGSGGSGGGSVHRYLLRRMYIELTRLGYNVDLPDQNDPGELPDAVGNLPPELDDMSLSKAIRTLKEEYPAIRALSGDAPLVVEAESKGISKPGGPVKNLAKAPEDQSVMFVVADGGSDGFTNNARRLANIFVDAPFTNPRCPADAERKFYTKNPCPTEHTESIDIKAGTKYAIHPDPDASTQWVEMADGSIVCREVNGEDLARYDDLEAFTNRSGEQFPGVAYYDRDKRVHVAEWVDESGERQRIKRGSKSELRKEVSVIQAPVIPEVLFDDVPSPEEVSEDVDIVIVPNEPEDEDAPMPELEVYDIETGETESLSSYLGVDLGERGRVGDVPAPDEDSSDEGAMDDEEKDLSEMTIEERMKELGIGDE